MLPIGQLIRDELLGQERSVTWLTDKLCCKRQNVYDIFQRTNIDAELLMRISLVLNHNFFDDYGDEYRLATERR